MIKKLAAVLLWIVMVWSIATGPAAPTTVAGLAGAVTVVTAIMVGLFYNPTRILRRVRRPWRSAQADE